MKIKKTAITLIAISILFFQGAGFAVADEVPSSTVATSATQEQSAGTLTYIDASSMLFIPAKGVDVDLKTLTASQDGKTEELPTIATDATGATVKVEYTQQKQGILISVSEVYQTRGIGQCLTGIGGGAVTGAGTLGLGGAAVGTITIPVIGTVSGGLLGGIVGGIGGGLTGAATFCF